jgi:hypothetical protein
MKDILAIVEATFWANVVRLDKSATMRASDQTGHIELEVSTT